MSAKTHYVWCPWPCPIARKVGLTHFHVLGNALAVANYDNRQAGRKVARVVMDQGHFHVKVGS